MPRVLPTAFYGIEWYVEHDSCYGVASGWPCGLMDKASDFGSEDCEFESRRGRNSAFLVVFFPETIFFKELFLNKQSKHISGNIDH